MGSRSSVKTLLKYSALTDFGGQPSDSFCANGAGFENVKLELVLVRMAIGAMDNWCGNKKLIL